MVGGQTWHGPSVETQLDLDKARSHFTEQCQTAIGVRGKTGLTSLTALILGRAQSVKDVITLNWFFYSL